MGMSVSFFCIRLHSFEEKIVATGNKLSEFIVVLIVSESPLYPQREIIGFKEENDKRFFWGMRFFWDLRVASKRARDGQGTGFLSLTNLFLIVFFVV